MFERLRTYKSIPEAFDEVSSAYPDQFAYLQAKCVDETPDGPRRWEGELYRDIRTKVCALSSYLIKEGLKKGDKVAILSSTRPEWMIADLATLSAGGITVSIYHSVNVQETGYILYDSDAEIVIAENEEQVKKLLRLAHDPCSIPATEDRPAKEVQIVLKKIIAIESVEPHPIVIQLGAILDQVAQQNLPSIASTLNREDVSSLVYTSGTTGPPKGVVQTHGNHLSNVWQAARTGLFAPAGDIFLFLPLAHSYARLVGYIGFLTETKLKFPAIISRKNSVFDPASIVRDMREGSAEVVPSVPRIFEKMLDGLRDSARKHGIGPMLLRVTLHAAKEVYQAKKEGRETSILNRIVFQGTASIRIKIRNRLFGPNFKHGVSGGAKLPSNINDFFSSLGINIYEGYGLTETCVVTNVNLEKRNKIGSVGPALDEVQIKIASDGEILFKGPNITKGYYNRPTATKASWDEEGWFHTGDLGSLDSDGFLYITGRKKELIVTAGGKKIAPTTIEDKLKFSKYISQAVLYGDGKPYCIVLLTLDEGAVRQFLEAHGVRSINTLKDDVRVRELIGSEIESVNKTLSQYETIKKFSILEDDFTIENGLLTPTLKVKRNEVFKRFGEVVEGLYK